MFVVELSPSSLNVGSVTALVPILNPSVAAKVGTPFRVSLAVAVSVMMSPVFARLVFVLFEVIVTVVNEGVPVSTITVDEFVVALITAEVLPAGSLAVKEKLTSPLSTDATV